MKTIGFIGLGNMGKGMSVNLAKESYKIIGYDINHDAYNYVKDHDVLIAENLNSLMNKSDIVITMLPDGSAVKKVWSEIIDYSKPNQYLIDCSTIDVKTSIEMQMQAKKGGYLHWMHLYLAV